MGKNKTLERMYKLAEQLPVIMTRTHEKHIVKGSELWKQGQTRINSVNGEGGEVVQPDKEYMVAMPVQIAMNHRRNVRKAYEKDGLDGVYGYVKAVHENAGSSPAVIEKSTIEFTKPVL
jgi:hypothetical protein